jgi:hypothetical protein
MAPIYTVMLRDKDGLLESVSQDYLDLAISRTVNAPDIAALVYDSNSLNVQYLIHGSIIEIYREDTEAGIASTQEFAGFIRRVVRTINDRTTYEITALGAMSLLGDRIVAWKAERANRSKFTAQPAETIVRTLVVTNAGNQATVAGGRILEGTLITPNLTFPASAGTGTVLSVSLAYQNLLEAVQKVCDDGGGDFSVTYDPVVNQFGARWHLGQLGTNRTATVKLSVPLGTIGELIVSDDRIDDFTAVIVGGQGEGKARRIATRPATLPTSTSLREVFADARNLKKATLGRLRSHGQILLNRQARKRVTYTATLLQNAALRYGRDYFLGDLVTILDGTTAITQKVQGVDLAFTADGKESVDVTLANNA